MSVLAHVWTLPAMVLVLALVCLYQQMKALGLLK